MALSDDLVKLSELHQRGKLTDEEFAQAKSRVLGAAAGDLPPGKVVNTINSLRRSVRDAWLGGVCGGIGELTGIAAWACRLVFVLLALFGGMGVFIYLVMWVLVPQEDRPFTADPGGVHTA